MNYADRVKDTTTATSTATVALNQSAPAGFRAFAAALAVGTTGIPVCVSDTAGNWEISSYTLTSASLLTREAVLASSNAGAAVSFPAGAKDVFCTMPAQTMAAGMTNQDDVGFDIVLLIGQSNMAGRGTLEALVDVTDPRVWQFGGSTGDTGTYRKLTLASDPMPHSEGPQAGQMGLGTWFGRAYASAIPTNRRVLLVPYAMGSTALVGGPWASGSPGGSLYEGAITNANLAITAAQALYPSSRFVGAVWAQGEADAINSVSQATYAAALKAVIAGIRSRVTGASNSWFVINGMVPEYVTANSATYGPIQSALQQVASETDRCGYVTGASGFNVGVHYNAQGYRVMGSRAALAVKTAIAYRFADTTAPTALSAAVANATPTTVSISMSEAMNSGIAPSSSAFAVTGHTVTGVSISGSTISLTVTPAFVNGETRTASYTQPGSNQARDVAGNLLADFSGLAITDNVLPVATGMTMTGPTSGAANAASTNFTIGVTPVGGTITGTVVVTPSDVGAGGSFSPASVSLTSGSPSATFTYTPTSTGARTISVTNNGGLTNPSNITYTASAAATVPDAPTIGTATSGNASASVAFTAPANNGGTAITGYTVTSSPGGITANGASSPINVTGLTNGTAYTFTVHATNGVGNSAESAASNSVTPSAPASFATLNPADKNANMVLSNSDLTGTGQVGNAAWQGVRSTVSKTSGKWYWEITLNQVNANAMMLGVGSSGAALTNFVGSDVNGWGYYQTGQKFHTNSSASYGASYATGDIIGVALDLDAGTLTFYKNGVSQGQAYTGITGTIFAMFSMKGGTPPCGVTVNFGASAWAQTPPAGYSGLS
jgi:hypothetical protein